MSQFDLDSPSHDIFVSLAINSFLTSFGGDIVSADGRLPIRGHQVRTPPTIHGYRPDAVIVRNQINWLLEIKSMSDLYSQHSKTQFKIISNLLRANTNIALFLFVFDVSDKNLFIPPELLEFEHSNRLIIAYE